MKSPALTSLKRLSIWTYILLLLVLASIVAAPFLLKDNQVAQVLFSIILSCVTTTIGIYASAYLSHESKQDELTRYGLQAWRNLDSLSIKVSQRRSHRSNGEADDRVAPEEYARLEGWLLDIDQAKLAWQDLLKEVFALQERIQRETEELARDYKERIKAAPTPADRTALELKQRHEIEQKIERAPLPLRIPEEVNCPKCQGKVSTVLGINRNETTWPKCPHCSTKFPIHRLDGGGIKYGEIPDAIVELFVDCPTCNSGNPVKVPKKRIVGFPVTCEKCRECFEFRGNSSKNVVKKLDSNAAFTCPGCSEQNAIWISPTKAVRFKRACRVCRREVLIIGNAQMLGVNLLMPLQEKVAADHSPAI